MRINEQREKEKPVVWLKLTAQLHDEIWGKRNKKNKNKSLR